MNQQNYKTFRDMTTERLSQWNNFNGRQKIERFRSFVKQNISSILEDNSDLNKEDFEFLNPSKIKYQAIFQKLEHELEVLKIEDQENILKLRQEFKERKINNAEFSRIRSTYSNRLENLRNRIAVVNNKIRNIEIDELNAKVASDPKISSLSYLDSENDFEKILWEDIQSWWSNASWVFQVIWNPWLVAIKKSAWNYIHVWDLPYYYSKLWNCPNFPRVLKAVKKDKDMYLFMEKANWIQLDNINKEEIGKITQKHFNEFVANIIRLESAWFTIDPSKASNFFYDSKIWFVFIDIHPGNKWNSSKYYKDWILTSILSRKNKEISLKENVSITYEIEKKVNEALNNNNIESWNNISAWYAINITQNWSQEEKNILT